jgi:hypothetical protein
LGQYREFLTKGREKMKTCYFKGDLAKYTGRSVVLHGGLFYEIELIEGHRKGERVVTQRAPV